LVERKGSFISGGSADGHLYFSNETLNYKIFLLNMSMDFYKTFGVFYNIFFYPIARVFQSNEEMQLLAHRSLYYLKTFVTPQNRALV